MIPSLDKLGRMLSLETEQGYENRAVIGGLDRVLSWWPRQAGKECLCLNRNRSSTGSSI